MSEGNEVSRKYQGPPDATPFVPSWLSDETPIASRESVPHIPMESTECSLQELRVKVAEYRGWQFEPHGGYVVIKTPAGKVVMRYYPQDDNEDITFRLNLAGVPDYCNDLNACAEFEKTLTEWQDREYRNTLIQMTACGEHRATSEQRCRAFVAVMSAPSVSSGVGSEEKKEELGIKEPSSDIERVQGPMEGIGLIAAERQRQLSSEGYTNDHDDKHTDGELAVEAARWAAEGTDVACSDDGLCGTADHRESKPRLCQLVIAGALIAAEIDRLLRKAPSVPEPTEALTASGVSALPVSPSSPTH